MDKYSRIYVAGSTGMVGRAIVNNLQAKGYFNIITSTRGDVDLSDKSQVDKFFEMHQPQYVFLAAAKVGGIFANNLYRADFITDNITIQTNVITACDKYNTKLLFLGSSCIYPKDCPQPIKEEYLLTGPLEQTNLPYAIAKIAGLKMCEAYRDQYHCNFISVMPTNLYGPNDNYDLNNAHVLPSLIRKFFEAVNNDLEFVEIWGTGKPYREFMHVDDCADACVYLMETYDDRRIVNIGTGVDISISLLASMLKEISGFKGDIRFNTSKPDGTFQKLLDVTHLHSLGWIHRIRFAEGLKNTYEAYGKNRS
jgi:GDP-L-fucose synthase